MLAKHFSMSLIKMSKNKKLTSISPSPAPTETVGEDGAEIKIVKNKKPVLPLSKFSGPKKRRALIPNKDGVDRIQTVSRSNVHVEVDCRFLYKGGKPLDHVRLRIPLPKRSSIETRFLRRNPRISAAKLKAAVDRWFGNYINRKILRRWQSHKSSSKKINVENSIIEATGR